MKFVCKKDLLSYALGDVVKGASSKTTLPILECVLISAKDGKVKLTTSSIETEIVSVLDADVIIEGSICVDVKVLNDFVLKSKSDTISLELNDQKTGVKITTTTGNMNISAQNPADFPEFSKLNDEKFIVLSRNAFKDVVSQTLFSVSQEQSRPILTGALFEVENGILKVVTVDGYRISYKESELISSSEAGLSISAVIPAATLSEAIKVSSESEEVKISFDEKKISFDFGSTTLSSGLLEGEFLKYQQVFTDSSSTKIRVNAKELISKIQSATVIATDSKNPIKLDIKKDKILISCNSTIGNIEESLELVSFEGNELTIAFNPKYVLDALKAVKDDVVAIDFESSLTPCIISPSDSLEKQGKIFKYLILPIRISN